MTRDEFIEKWCYKAGINTEYDILRDQFKKDFDELLSGKAAQIIAVVREEWSVDNDEAVYDEIKRILK
jgi:hypothetical protein